MAAASRASVELAFPAGDDDRGDRIADEVRQGPDLGHEAVDAEDQRHAGNRNRGDDREGRGQGDEARTSDARGALGGEHGNEEQNDLVGR